MKSKYAELFTAKLNDMDLVLFEKHKDWDKWALAVNSDRCFMVGNNFDYFLCLPQHKEACLHWLNCGDVQHLDKGSHVDMTSMNDLKSRVGKIWSYECAWMDDDCEIRIKQKKEKRWMIYSERPLSIEIFSDESVCDTVFSSKLPTENKQKIEIEVEV
ncbi:hypothetical protein NVP1105O_04 [Vibrio phage 1.105.O._10N.286.49.B4]|nr:hypothetical protein NVP1105O_04 [Vibrio phage 1.105.O._10N.286.49.B4]